METPGNGVDNSNSELEIGSDIQVTEDEFCRLAKISQSFAYSSRKKKLLPYHQLGRRVTYSWPRHFKIFLARTEKNAVDKNTGRKHAA